MTKINPQQTQHRPTRDNAHAKELSEAKRLVAKLSREVARLRRNLEKKGPQEEEDPETLAGTEPAKPKKASPHKMTCAACGSQEPGKLFTTPSGIQILVCSVCSNRQIQ